MASLTAVRAPAAAAPPRTFRLQWPSLLQLLLLLLIGFAVLAPVLFLTASSFQLARPGQPSNYGIANWVTAFAQPGMVDAIVNTLIRTLIAVIISLPISITTAWLLARSDVPGKGILELLFWITFFMPVLPMTLGWILMADPQFGLLNQLAKSLFGWSSGPFNIYSLSGIVWVHLATRTIVSQVILLMPAFRNMDSSMEEASRTSGVGYLGTMARVFVPIMAPAITVVMLVSIIFSLESFEVEQVLGPPFKFYVYSTKIYQLTAREPAQYGAATALGVVILLSMLPLILLQQRISRGRNYTTVSGKYRSQPTPLGVWKWPAFGVLSGMGLIFTALPLCLLILGSCMRLFGFFNLAAPYTTAHWQAVLGDPAFLKALGNSLRLGIGTALVSMVLAALVAYVVVKSRFAARGMLDVLSWLPITIPGVIMGLGLLWLFLAVPFVRPLYGTMVVLIWATSLSSLTLGVQLSKSHLLQLNDELEESSRVLGGSWWYTFRRVILPLIAPVLTTVAIVAFISAVRNIAHVAILVTSSTQPLATYQLNLMIDGRYEPAAVIGVVVVLLTTGVAILGRSFGLKFGIREGS